VPRDRLDPQLGGAFHVRNAIDEGVSRKRLRGSDLVAPFYGVRTRHTLPAAHGYAPLLRAGDRFSHTTAAALWGAPLPDSVRDAVHVTAALGGRPRSKGCIGHQSRPVDTAFRHGLPVSGVAQTLMECGAILELDDLVAVTDFMLLDPHVLDPSDLRPHASRSALDSWLRFSRGPGVRRARRAVALAREGVESPMETRLRLLLQREGMTAPECGYALMRPGGTRVGWFDLAWPQQRVLVEYDGDQHRTSSRQYDRDIRRFDDAADLGWRVVRVRSRGILQSPGDTLERVRRALG